MEIKVEDKEENRMTINTQTGEEKLLQIVMSFVVRK